MTGIAEHLAPVRGKARIEVLDILRGIAILGIFYMNIPFMGARVFAMFHDIRSVGWSPADQATWMFIQVTWEGTQRCLLEFLFGAGMMVLTAKAMTPDGPVAVADLYYRRNLWLLAFGFFDIFVLIWPGDILHVYALAALFLFPFRKLAPKTLIALGLIWATCTAIGIPEGGVGEYVARSELVAQVNTAQAHQRAHAPLTAADRKALKDWQEKLDKINKVPPPVQKLMDAEAKAHKDGGFAYVQLLWGAWMTIAAKGSVLFGVIEAFSAMLIGIALWKWGVIQGQRSGRFYLWLMIAGYGFGFAARCAGAVEQTWFMPWPKTYWITQEYARLAVGLGHVGLVNLAVKSAAGRAVFAPFKAAGRTAFSLYFCEQIIGGYILFAPWGLNWWGRFGWAGLAAIATVVVIVLLIVANIWQRYFVSGPFEWAWRSLAYLEWQPFRRRRGVVDSDPLPGPVALPA